jgi:uncharacterized protein (TIGR01777 family)
LQRQAKTLNLYNDGEFMRVIITGGTGLIGKALAKSLVNNNYEVIILSRSPRDTKKAVAGAKMVAWDGKTSQGWGHFSDGAYAIINFAGASIGGDNFLPVRWTPSRKRAILESRLDAGRAVLESIKQAKHKPRVLVQSSAIGYYGARDDTRLFEDSNPGDDFLAKTTQQWESITLPAEEMGVRRVIIRSGVVLALEGGAFNRLLLPFKLFAGGPMGSGKQYLSWIHIQDEVNIVRFLMENQEAYGAFNLTSPNPQTNHRFASTLGKVMRRPSFIPIPGFVLRLMFGEVATIVLDGQRVLPKRLQELGYQFKFPELELALRNLLCK